MWSVLFHFMFGSICDFVSISGSGFGSLTYKWKVVYFVFSSFGFLVWGNFGNWRMIVSNICEWDLLWDSILLFTLLNGIVGLCLMLIWCDGSLTCVCRLIPLVILWKVESLTIDRAGLVTLKFGLKNFCAIGVWRTFLISFLVSDPWLLLQI